MTETAASRARAEFGAVLGLDILGAAAALLIATRIWQTVTAARPRPFAAVTVELTGRNVDAAVTALAVAALAGVVAIVATRGLARRIVGGALAAVGAAMIWRSLAASAAVSAGRARSLAIEHHRGIVLGDATPHVVVSAGWAWASAVAGLLVLVSGGVVAARGHTWQGMAARYEAPSSTPPPTDLAMWNAIERGDDPTS